MAIEAGALIQELSELGDNAGLFRFLAGGGDVTQLVQQFPLATTPHTRADPGAVRREVRDALVQMLGRRESKALRDVQFGPGHIRIKVAVLGEEILALFAVLAGRQDVRAVNEIVGYALQTASDVAKAFEIDEPQNSRDAARVAAALAAREWVHLLAEYCEVTGRAEHHVEMLRARARITNTTLGRWPNLVGAAMVDLGAAAERGGKPALALTCFQAVRADLGYFAPRVDDERLPAYEKAAALYWLQRACEGLQRMKPDDAGAAREAAHVRELRRQRGLPDAASGPRYGPIARSYLGEVPFLAQLLADLRTHGDDTSTCDRYGVTSSDVEFYRSAMGSYGIRDTILAGAQVTYDEAHQLVFDALDLLERAKA